MTSTHEPNITVPPQPLLCICSRKWKTKLIVTIYFETKMSKLFFQNHFFYITSLESELESRFGRLRNRLRSIDRARSITVNSLVRASSQLDGNSIT